jgi:hypothetical protein
MVNEYNIRGEQPLWSLPTDTSQVMEPLGPMIFIPEVSHTPSPRTRRPLKPYHVGSEGRIAHLKHQYAAGRSRLRGTERARIWENWSVLT